MTNPIKATIGAITLVAASVCAQADNIEVIQIKYSHGITDYIPASEIARISFARGVDVESELYNSVNGQFDRLKALMTNYSDAHFDFSYPAIMLGLDCQTEDMVSRNTGYNWFSHWAKFSTQTKVSPPSVMMWRCMYSTITLCNGIISGNTANTDEEKLLKAQAYALRSWAYWNLVQTFAPNYSVNAQAPGVVILPDTESESYPLSTVSDVYDRILADIDVAINYLSDINLDPAHINVAEAKRYIGLSTAYGLRARYNLTMHRYAEAAENARLAIETSSARPLQPAAASYPGFNDAKLGNWMWAITITPDDKVVTSGIVNFSSHICSLLNSGYTSNGAARSCGKALHDYLAAQESDVRLNWFADAEGGSDNLSPTQQTVLRQCYQNSPLPYLNVKFDNYQGKVINPVPAADVPLMRIEEMYLIEAEGLAMSGETGRARTLLNDFVATYRNPQYVCAATDAAALQNEIIWQRRAEFWGEGVAFFDKLRLQLDMDRYGDENVAPDYMLRIRGTSPFMLCRFPKFAPLVDGFDYDAEYSSPTPGTDGTWNE